MKSSILNFFLLVLRISLDLNLNASHKGNKFSKTLLEKDPELILSGRNRTIVFNISFVLLQMGVNHILKKQSYKKDALGAYGSGHIKIILALLMKVVSLYMGAIIVQIKVLSIKGLIS